MGKKTLFVGVVGLSLLLAALGCAGTAQVGSGEVVTEAYDVSGFNRLDVSSAVRVDLSQDGEESVSVETNSDLLEYLVVEVRAGTLYVGLNDRGRRLTINPTDGIHFTIGVDELERLEVSGASDVAAGPLSADDFVLSVGGASDVQIEALDVDSARIEASGSSDVSVSDLQTDKLDVAASGASTVEVSGEAVEQVSDVEGASHYRAESLESEDVYIEISGASDAELRASKTLGVDASGASRVEYYGDPQVSQQLSGASDLTRRGE
jgi:hypothetical protein